ncbi:hypothetical protein [Levilactobacillus brevis]|uniref:hypothetical protein n=1 Tax=Levilactobacillus brevis TaxID=1580 RepID=UPI000464F74E|nr:hypothetical protein [Levilactobacillus brevis]
MEELTTEIKVIDNIPSCLREKGCTSIIEFISKDKNKEPISQCEIFLINGVWKKQSPDDDTDYIAIPGPIVHQSK